MKRFRTLLPLLLLAAGGCHRAAPAPAAAIPATTDTAIAAQRRAEAMAELRTYFFDAARNGDGVLINEYVKSGFPVDARTPQGYTALILAAYHGHLETVKQLAALGADPCARDGHGSTALMGATFKVELGVVKYLLDQPCTHADDANGDGQTAAMYAALAGNGRLIDMLRERGANLGMKDASGRSAASIARQQGAYALARRIDTEGRGEGEKSRLKAGQ